MAVSKVDRQLELLAREVLAPDEPLVAVVRAMAVGAFDGRLGVLGELLAGSIPNMLLAGESIKRAHRARFPASLRMVVAMTDRRVLVWKATAFTHRPTRLLGEVALGRISWISVEPALDRKRVTFAFVDAASVTISAYKRDEPVRFVEALKVRQAARAQAPATIPAPIPPPPRSPILESEPLPVAVATAEPPATAPVPDVAVSVPGLPAVPKGPTRTLPKPPLLPKPSPRFQFPVSSASSDGPQKKCMQCGSQNPLEESFCRRCGYPFGVPAQSLGAPVPTAVVAGGPAGVDPTASPGHGLQWTTRPAPIKTKRTGLIGKAVIGVMVAFVAYTIARPTIDRLTGPHLMVPDSIAGIPKIVDPSLNEQVRRLTTVGKQNGATIKAAYYGYEGSPQVFFAATPFKESWNRSPDDLFRDFAGGFAAATTRTVVDLRTKTTESIGDASLICAKVRGDSQGSICMWTDQDILGVVGAFGKSIPATQNLTALVRTAVES